MTTQTKTPQTERTSEQLALIEARAEAIKGWNEAEANLRKAQADERSAPKPSAARTLARKRRLSWGAKKANRRAEISSAELDLRLAGILATNPEEGQLSPWIEPEAPKAHKTRQVREQAAIQSDLDKVRALIKTLTDDDAAVKHDAETRIKALKREADGAGYKLS